MEGGNSSTWISIKTETDLPHRMYMQSDKKKNLHTQRFICFVCFCLVSRPKVKKRGDAGKPYFGSPTLVATCPVHVDTFCTPPPPTTPMPPPARAWCTARVHGLDAAFSCGRCRFGAGLGEGGRRKEVVEPLDGSVLRWRRLALCPSLQHLVAHPVSCPNVLVLHGNAPISP